MRTYMAGQACGPGDQVSLPTKVVISLSLGPLESRNDLTSVYHPPVNMKIRLAVARHGPRCYTL